jgi:hypothetical protein
MYNLTELTVKHKNVIYAILTALLIPLTGFGQEDPWITSIKQRFQLYSSKAVQEKIYLHIDRPFYLVGETMWFKAYNVEGTSNSFLGMSKVAYLEVLDKDNNSVAQTKFSLLDGKGNGALIIPSTITSGVYKVRCYTNWMKNFSAEYFFESSINVVNPFVKFDADPDEKKEITYDAGFFPEGGYLVRDLESKVAFRVIGPDGKGISFKGAVLNQNNDTLVRFEPKKFGIGYFMLKPAAETTYKIVLRDIKGRVFTYPLPEVRQEGFAMQVKDSTGGLVKVTVTSRFEDGTQGIVYLVAHTRQSNLFVEKKSLGKNRVEFTISKDKLAEGISHITILNEKLKPLCERLYFKSADKHLAISAKVAKTSFTTREKVTLDLSASLSKNATMPTNLSVAVYLEDSLKYNDPLDIESYLWVSSDLAGTVESPGYYLQKDNKDVSADIDNLMLTHGWRRFKWNEVLGNQSAYANLVEFQGHFIYGKVINTITNQPARGIESYLAALDFPARVYASISDDQGNVRFEVKDFYGAKEVTVQSNLTQDSIYRYEMANPFSKQFATTLIDRFRFEKTAENQLLTRAINMQTNNAFLPKAFAEPKAPITDSTAFFGEPDEKYFLDDFTRFPTMEEVLREYVRGIAVRRRQKEFHFRMTDKLVPNVFYSTDPLTLLDGIPIFNIDRLMEMDPLKIKKIETMNGRYFLGGVTATGIASFSTYQNDLAGFELSPKVLVFPYDGVQTPREFYQPRYDTKANLDSRLPDFRNLLLWSPNVTTDASGKAQIQFTTSDQPGRYRVVIQGMTGNGTAGSGTMSFDVERRNF